MWRKQRSGIFISAVVFEIAQRDVQSCSFLISLFTVNIKEILNYNFIFSFSSSFSWHFPVQEWRYPFLVVGSLSLMSFLLSSMLPGFRGHHLLVGSFIIAL